MIKGMTGFGSAPFALGAIRGTVEIKTVNHRYLDIAYYLPIGFGSIEHKIKQILEKDIQRGRITVAVKFTQKPSQSVSLNESAILDYQKFVRKVRKKYKFTGDLTVSDIMRLPGVVDTKENLLDAQSVWPAINKAIRKALKGLIMMRKREGKSLSIDLSKQMTRMSSEIRTIRVRSKSILKEKKKTLNADEFSSFQKGIDVNEEVARLLHFVDEVKKLLKATAPTGKRIDFIAQEMQRETNTIGSKFQDTIVSNGVIALKSKIEKIREQAQNIE